MDLPELVGVDRELGLRDARRGAPTRAFGRRRRVPDDDAVVAFCARARAVRARAARLPGEVVRGGDRPAAATSVRCARGASPKRCRRMRALGGLPGAGGALQARQEHRARAARRTTRSIARADRAGGAARCSRSSTRAGRAIEAAAAAAPTTGRRSPRSPACGRRRSVLHGSVRHGRRRAREDRAADADGGPARPHSELADISEIVPQTE